ncbi:TatD family hydrolase [Haliangium sp.]|uniref:TatD family hydrolase n=1 Tax=Haliangium sp. TaxID=2663208 RepID=UPI003D09E823
MDDPADDITSANTSDTEGDTAPPALVDIGVNLTNKAFRADLAEVLARAHAAGVTRMVVTGTGETESAAAAELAASAPGRLRSTAGVHPHHAKECGTDTLSTLRALAARPEVVAVGECGLDFDRNFSPPEAQMRWFEAQVELAAELGLPLFLHERAASEALLEVLRPRRDRLSAAVVHCFTGTGDELAAYLDLDLHIGITGWICDERRGAHLHELMGRIPLDRLMLETDAPYLVPRTLRPKPKRGRNEPAFLPHVLATVAAAAGRDQVEVAAATTATAERFFALPAA